MSILENWSPEQLLEHLSSFEKKQLMPPTSRTK
jgi:hypothetical protein